LRFPFQFSNVPTLYRIPYCIECSGVFQAARVACRLAKERGTDEAAHDFGVAGLGKCGREFEHTWLERFAQSTGDKRDKGVA